MIDEGLWLVCYETSRLHRKGYEYIYIFKSEDEQVLDQHLYAQIKVSFIITNMVRLGDLKEEKE